MGGKSTGFLEGDPEGEFIIEDGDDRNGLLLPRTALGLPLLLSELPTGPPVANGEDRPKA
jgi:hypothetical protein